MYPVLPTTIHGKFSEILPIIQSCPAVEGQQGYLYCFNCMGNRFKIGRSNNIEERILTHNKNNYLYAGTQLDNVFITGPFINCRNAETETIKTLINRGFIQFAGNEWFMGNYIEGANIIKEIKSEINKFGVMSFFYEKLSNTCSISRLFGYNKKTLEVNILDLRDIFLRENKVSKDLLTTTLFRYQLRNISRNCNWIKIKNDIVTIEKQN